MSLMSLTYTFRLALLTNSPNVLCSKASARYLQTASSINIYSANAFSQSHKAIRALIIKKQYNN